MYCEQPDAYAYAVMLSGVMHLFCVLNGESVVLFTVDPCCSALNVAISFCILNN